jgi:UPF0755 protein
MRSGAPTPGQRIKSAVAVLISLAVLGGGAAYVGIKGYAWYQDYQQAEDYIGDGDADIIVTVPSGATLTRIADILQSKDVIRDSETFLDVAEAKAKELEVDQINVDEGRYQLRTHWPSATALEVLRDPENRIATMVTVPEGLRWNDIKPQLSKESGLTEHDFDVAAAQPSKIDLPGYANGNVEGFLFPDTYELPTSAEEILKRMTHRYVEIAGELNLEARAAEMGLDARTIVIVASIIEAEVNIDDYRPMVARALYNRIATGMRLQIDSSLIYGLGLSGYLAITWDELHDASNLYNLYEHDGLPPTPISNPGRASLEAALYPADGDWLYWVTVDLESGETRFGATDEEHQANVEVMSAWCAEHPDYGC